MLATRLAQEQGADEALLVTPQDRVLEGPTFSVFCRIADGPWITPPLEDQVLDSITRRVLLAGDVGASEQILHRADLLDVTDGNLGAHLRKLEEAEYITVNKVFVERKPRTYVSATPDGRQVFREHVAALEAILKSK